MVLTADAITPKLSIQGYKKRSAVSYELNQVLGIIQDVHEVGKEDLLFRGSDAMLLAGPHAQLLEAEVVRWAKLHSVQLFCGEVYWRLLQLTDELTTLAEAVAKTHRSEEEEDQLRRVPERESLHRISERTDLLSIPSLVASVRFVDSAACSRRRVVPVQRRAAV